MINKGVPLDPKMKKISKMSVWLSNTVWNARMKATVDRPPMRRKASKPQSN